MRKGLEIIEFRLVTMDAGAVKYEKLDNNNKTRAKGVEEMSIE